MKLTNYYSLYEYVKKGKLLCWGVNLAKFMGLRYLLVRMDTNFVCNLRCKTCFFSAPDAKKLMISPMKLDLFKTIAKDVFPKTRILFLSCGAEPLMTKNFTKFLEVTAKYKVPYLGYSTNGLLLSEEIIRKSIQCKVSEITISIDGATKKTYEYIRTNGNFDKLMENLAMYKDIVSKEKGPTPSLRFNYTIVKSNYHEMPLIVELAKKYGVSVIKFRIYTDWGGVFELAEDNESLIGHEKRFNESLSEAKRIASKENIYLISPKEFSLNSRENKTEGTGGNEKSDSKPPCHYPWFFRYIDPLGRVRVCAELPLSEDRISENYSLNDFETSKKEKLRKYLLSTKPSESCYDSVCHGSCQERPNDDVNFIKSLD